MWPCKGNGIGVSMPQWLQSTAGYLLQNGYVSDLFIGKKGDAVWSSCWDLFIFPIVPLPGSFFHSISPLYFLLLICCIPSSLSPPLLPLSPLCPSHASWGTLISPSSPLLSSPLGPSCMQSRCQPGQEGQRLPHKGGDRVFGAKNTHSHTHPHAVPFSVLCCVLSWSTCTCTSHMYAPFLSLTLSNTHKAPRAGLGLGTGRAGAVCLSVISIPAGGSWPGQTSERSSRSR